MFPTISNCSVTTIVSAVLEPCFQLCFRSCCVICRNSLAVHAGLLTEPPTLPTISGVSQQHSVYNSSEAIVRFDCGNRFANRPVLSGCSFCVPFFASILSRLASSTPCFPWQNNLSDLEVLALMIATLSHDLDHRGVNNSYIQRCSRRALFIWLYMYDCICMCGSVHSVFFFNFLCVCACVCVGVTTHWPSSTATRQWSITTSTTAWWSSTAP